VPVTLDTLVTIKISIQGSNRKFKVPMRDLGAHVLPHKLRLLLNIPPNQEVVFERFSDSAGAYITLDAESPTVYKTLFRAAKAKLKLRLKATIVDDRNSAPSTTGTIPLYPYARLPAFHSTNMRSVTKPADPAPIKPFQLADGEGEAPVPKTFTLQKSMSPFPSRLCCSEAPPNCAWSVYCNTCDKPMANEHYHCSICDDGDYDLCGACVDAGHHCPGEGHWLIKRFVRSGKVINSTTERVGPKVKPETSKEMPGSFTEEKRVESESFEVPTRTCNSCIRVLPETEFVTCKHCDDYDLCIPCVLGAKHGHHPGHAFEPVSSKTELGPLTGPLIQPGRNVRHHAICDGCNTNIYGIRFKCTDCPDWDYCSQCMDDAKHSHPKHRFVPVYESLIGSPSYHACRHFGIYCDGSLCKDKMNQSYIEGVRYKCAVCHDTDFCATCEAHPSNRHNRTHPMIKFKTPVKNVSVTTTGEDKHGAPMESMGDHPARKSASTETVSVAPSNAATEVHTIVDLKPSDDGNAKPMKEKIQIKDLLASQTLESDQADEPVGSKAQFYLSELNAHFIRDIISDGTKVNAGECFLQSWTLRNPGPNAWPAGCSVRYAGGDNMLNVNANHPSSAAELAEATESNVLGREVSVGEEASFAVVMKAPSKEGTSISYWRLKAANGMPFGHRLWCHIEVLPCSSQAPVDRDFSMLKTTPIVPKRSQESERDEVKAQATQPRVSPELMDYQMQLMLLEQQHKCRLLVARQRGQIAQELIARNQELPLENTGPSHLTAVPKTESTGVDESESTGSEGSPFEESRMIFPFLEKESPVSSTHEAIATDSVASVGTIPRAETVVSAASDGETLETFEDIVSVDLDSGSEENGFLTDEEYDILDASDTE
ncbi:hypothetical protein K490DRAFT_23033, partial [Saccharata proteae CBS 121410]